MTSRKQLERFSSALVLSVFGLFVLGCSTLPAGQRHVLAKQDRDYSLIEPLVPVQSGSETDYLDKMPPEGIVGIKINGAYLRYLEAVERAELAIFARVFVRAQDEAGENLVWEKIYVNTEEENEYFVVNKDAFLPKQDIVLLPPIHYEGQDITVSFRIVELDQGDNRRWIQIIESIAATGAQFQPESAAGISAFQAILSFLIQNNADDIEFQFDFSLSENLGTVQYTDVNGKIKDIATVLEPKQNRFVIIKTENAERKNLPSDYPGYATTAIRYVLKETTKIATLGILNWPIFERDARFMNPEKDTYAQLFGYPFAVDPKSRALPDFTAGHLQIGKIPGQAPTRQDLRLTTTEIHSKLAGREEKWELFRDQSYVMFSIYPAEKGVDLKLLEAKAKQEKAVENLQLQTRQLTATDFNKGLDVITRSFRALAIERHIKEKYEDELAKAKTPEDVQAARRSFEVEMEKLKGLLTPQTEPRLLETLAQEFESRSNAKLERLGSSGKIHAASAPYFNLGQDPMNLIVSHPKGYSMEAKFRLKPVPDKAGAQFTDAISEIPMANLKTHSEILIYNNTAPAPPPPGAYELVIINAKDPRESETLTFHVVNPGLATGMKDSEGNALTSNSQWKKGASATIAGSDLGFVDEVVVQAKVDVAGTVKSFNLPRKNAGEGVKSKIVIENETGIDLTLLHVDFKMKVDELTQVPRLF